MRLYGCWFVCGDIGVYIAEEGNVGDNSDGTTDEIELRGENELCRGKSSDNSESEKLGWPQMVHNQKNDVLAMVLYISSLIEQHIVWYQKSQPSHCMPLWLILMGFEQAPQGYFQFGPGFSWMSPHKSSVDSRTPLILRSNHVLEVLWILDRRWRASGPVGIGLFPARVIFKLKPLIPDVILGMLGAFW